MNKKKIITILIFFVLMFSIFCFSRCVVATSEPLEPWVSGSGTISTIDTPVGKIWKTATIVIQVVAFAGIIFIGIKYMFTSADMKSDIKGSLILVVLGIILIFAAQPIVKIIHDIVQELL